MANRTTRAQLELIVDRIHRVLEKDHVYDIEHTPYGWKLTAHKGAVNISPNCTKKGLYDWLHAFAYGLDIGKKVGSEMEYNKCFGYEPFSPNWHVDNL